MKAAIVINMALHASSLSKKETIMYSRISFEIYCITTTGASADFKGNAASHAVTLQYELP